MISASPGNRESHQATRKGRARIDYDGRPTWVDTPGLGDLAPGQYVVLYAGLALERMPAGEAEEFLDFEARLEGMLEDASG